MKDSGKETMAVTSTPLDPAPRAYSPGVTVIRRAERGGEAAPQQTSIREIESWLLGPAIGENDLLFLFESLVWRLVAADLPLDRASLHVGTLHPQLFGFAWNWERADGICDEVRVPEASLQTDSYKKSPLFRVIEYGETFRGHIGDPDMVATYPLLKDLADKGIADYIALPLGGGSMYHNAATVATKRTTGFAAGEFASLQRVLGLFALHVERHIAQRIAGNVLDTYLGRLAGRRVLDGTIKRGSGDAIRAIIWVSDLRGFTDLTDRLSEQDMTLLLNTFFECLAGTVLDYGGEVLKFIGDGLLAVFPLSFEYDQGRDAAHAALAAAERALQGIADINRQPPQALKAISGWHPLRAGIALHEGDVFFGNVGAPNRLDFTVIGRAVNEASRVEALCKSLGRTILVTEPVARRLDQEMEDLGAHPLRGVAKPVLIFGPRGNAN